MKNFYALILLFLAFGTSYAQTGIKTSVVNKAYFGESEEWTDYSYKGKIVFSSNSNEQEGRLRIGNFDFLSDLCEGKAKFADKATYSTAEFLGPRKMSVTTDKQGVVNSTYEGNLVFQGERDYYSIVTIITLLEKNGNLVGVKVYAKDNPARVFAFGVIPTS